ncbi:hypothetical protein ncot_09860 [Nocardioides sp. JQ2195]|uniref:hypothetical protein n=1 Tax=Nocardioides sp. JQ2195 TaxID=2592334 RepID=UPI00143E3AA8|nr:hypothetical protein [Nocardioides sp. JQ2195]QIX26874.1 hypothetical protein ncot_09860 [Nocardioides sp. JQ2195]
MKAVVALLLALLLPLAGCSQSREDVRDDYCAQVKEDGPDLIRISDEAGAEAFEQMLPTLEGLAEKSPQDLQDEWQVYLNALRGWRDALEKSGVEASDLAGGMPEDLGREDKRRIRGAATVLRSQQVSAASSGIEQHALDVCGTALL